ncbi:hypothetical protein [Blastococcus sp. PRF04-17]|uniref:hypothetical protein n=1 Tax=Blastococcus sp. PRF04-17 TaxID=2933797 RepID=UPI001FF49F2A|nr:hypothetical protein [Blastococcus sp. PRF04-17]UOY00553.1 hypothetical protein MVA48_16325 [Blastococcus sp. PRF04-17]
MTTPRNPDDREPWEGSGWQEPAHLAGDDQGRDDQTSDEPNFADRRKRPRDEDLSSEAWRPAGWDLPAATPQRDDEPYDGPPRSEPPVRGPAAGGEPSWAPPATGPGTTAPAEPARGGLFGSRRNRDPEMARAFTPETDPLGAQSWALQHGWTVSDGTGPEDAGLAELIASAPVRPGKEARAASVLRGRAGSLELVAFDIAYPLGRGLVPKYAVTAAPLLGSVPGLRLSPARFWKHRTGGLVPVPSGDEGFDARWMLLAAEDSPQARRLAQDPAVHGLLLGTDDGDEFWTASGHVCAVRPDGHRPQLLEHHARLLTAIVGALAAGL